MNKIYRGDTFAPLCTLKDKNRVPINLDNYTLEAEIHNIDFSFKVDVPCTALDQTSEENVGIFTLGPLDTSTWPIGEVFLRISRIKEGFKKSVKITYKVGI